MKKTGDKNSTQIDDVRGVITKWLAEDGLKIVI